MSGEGNSELFSSNFYLRPQIGRFRKLYMDSLKNFSSNLYFNDGRFQQDMEIRIRKEYLLRLPSNLQKRIDLMKLSETGDQTAMVRNALAKIVANTDKSQVRAQGGWEREIIILNNCRL